MFVFIDFNKKSINVLDNEIPINEISEKTYCVSETSGNENLQIATATTISNTGKLHLLLISFKYVYIEKTYSFAYCFH